MALMAVDYHRLFPVILRDDHVLFGRELRICHVTFKLVFGGASYTKSGDVQMLLPHR